MNQQIDVQVGGPRRDLPPEVFCVEDRTKMDIQDFARRYRCPVCQQQMPRYPKAMTLEQAIDAVRRGESPA